MAMRIRDIRIRDDTFIRVQEGRRGDIEMRVWIERDGMSVSTRAGLYCPVGKVDDCVRAIQETKEDIQRKMESRNDNRQ